MKPDDVNQETFLTLPAIDATLHKSVMIREVLESLDPQNDKTYVDGTFGLGGYTQGIFASAPNAKVIGIDQDPEAIARGQKLVDHFEGRLVLLEGRFSEVQQILAREGIKKVDGFVLDLGVSSPQLDQGDRGFSFRFDGPLDMRMNLNGPTAADVVNTLEESELADVIFSLGGEHKSRRIASAIVKAREVAPLTRTLELANIVRSVVGFGGANRLDPATRTFQALRIYVNRELEELEEALEASLHILRPEGRLVVVSFHSLEDGRVKEFIRTHSGEVKGVSRHAPMLMDVPQTKALLKPLFRNAKSPQEDELSLNPRSRSARLRAVKRLEEGQ